jgi:hypothetical protein
VNRILELIVMIAPSLALGALLGRMSLKGKLSESEKRRVQAELSRDELFARVQVLDALHGINDQDLIRAVADTGHVGLKIKPDSN